MKILTSFNLLKPISFISYTLSFHNQNSQRIKFDSISIHYNLINKIMNVLRLTTCFYYVNLTCDENINQKLESSLSI